MFYGPHLLKELPPAVGVGIAGQEGPFGPGWSAESDAREAENLDAAVDAYAAYVVHIEGCGECRRVRCGVGQELVEVYLREVRRRRWGLVGAGDSAGAGRNGRLPVWPLRYL